MLPIISNGLVGLATMMVRSWVVDLSRPIKLLRSQMFTRFSAPATAPSKSLASNSGRLKLLPDGNCLAVG